MLTDAQRLIQSFYGDPGPSDAARKLAADWPPHRPVGTPPRPSWRTDRATEKAQLEAFAKNAERTRQARACFHLQATNPNAWTQFGSLKGPVNV